LAHPGIGFSQDGQKDRGRTIDWPRGNRYATTPTKLPTDAPKMKTISAINR
jgi:hypothetical protein